MPQIPPETLQNTPKRRRGGSPMRITASIPRPSPTPRRTPPTTPPAWHAHLTIDTLVLAARSTILHPFFAWTLPLLLRGLATPYTALSYRLTIAYAVLVTAVRVIEAANERLAFGPPRTVDWQDEVVAITGGASGLGLLLAEVYALRGVGVAVLDVKDEPELAHTGLLQYDDVRYYQCDVGDAEQVWRAKERIEDDLGPPTILINAAAIAPLSPFHSQDASSAALTGRTYAANILSNHHTISAFLPAMLARPDGGTIVTVGSVLGQLGCASLAAYCATKAAQTALHNSLTAELRIMDETETSHPRQVKTVLVTLGQLDTDLFARVRSPSWFWGPVVEAREVVTELCKLVDEGRAGEVAMPLYTRWIGILGVLPSCLREAVRWWSGMDAAGWGAWTELEREKTTERNGMERKIRERSS